AAMVQTAQDAMVLESLKEPARVTLEAAMQSDSDEARSTAEGLTHWFGAHGIMDFRYLLPSRVSLPGGADTARAVSVPRAARTAVGSDDWRY
ncbi:MAG: hypothetical protein AB1609_17120, partial [Bacillota bacterium]